MGLYKKYYPSSKIPVFYTYISGLDFENPIRYADSVIAIAIDLYLGKNYSMYSKIGLPEYKQDRMDKEYILPDCIKQLAFSKLKTKDENKTLLDLIIKEGKVLYFTEKLIPELKETTNMGYTVSQIEWANKNEINLWAFFIKNKLLFNSKDDVINKFILDGPFCSALSNEAPARIGVWIGWQIVRSYMKNNNISLSKLMQETNASLILNKSKYKPGKP